MLTQDELTQILEDYLDQVIPAMLAANYHLVLVKGGPEYAHLPEQSHFAHIVNGVFGLHRLCAFLADQGLSIPGLTEATYRKGLALYTTHEVHKAPDVELLGTSQFSIPLSRLREEYERLGLPAFAGDVDDHLLRAANVHKRSTKHGDLLLSSDPEATRLWLLVRIADTLASVKTPAETVASLRGYLADLSPLFAPTSPPGRYALYYHEIKDVRGVLTNVIHQAVAQQLAQALGFFPLLYFATGTVYLGPARNDILQRGLDIDAVVDVVISTISELGAGNRDVIRAAQRPKQYDFEPFVFQFADIADLLDFVKETSLAISEPNVSVIRKDINGLLGKQELPEKWTTDTVWNRFLMSQDTPRIFREHLVRARHYLFYADKLLRALAPEEDPIEWFPHHFEVPTTVKDALREVGTLWAKGGPGKYTLPVAYHFLRGPDFAHRPAEALPPAEVIERLHRKMLAAFASLDTEKGRQAAVANLGWRQELETYLQEHLYLSFAPEIHLVDDNFKSYSRPKGKSHTGKVCSICNRASPYTQQLRTGILDDFGRVFSNRVLPAIEAPQGNRLWCPICQLEFVFRKLLGMGLPAAAHYKNSRRIYLYILPTFSFTPEHVRLFEPLLHPFRRVTGLPVRDYGNDDGLPRLWLERRSFDPYWLEELQDVLEREADKIAGRGGRNFVGERISLGDVRGQPHYYLVTWEKTARETEKEKPNENNRIATRTEAWAKALFAATVISGLTSCKVYVTERPYLPVADPAELKATITLDAPPPALRSLLGGRMDEITLYGRGRGRRSGLEHVLDLSAALWTVTTHLRPGKDKNIAARLARLNADPLAGAHFYKEYGREHDGQSPFHPFDLACEVLLDIHGGELMSLVEKIAEKSLEIALPRGTSGRGKARRYELVFREGVSAMRKAQQMIPEMREAAIRGKPPSPQAIAELKRLAAGTLLKSLERRQISGRGEIRIRAWRNDLSAKVGEFIDILVDDLYLGRAGGSFARFLRLENSLADGIYYYTDRNLSRHWEAYKQQRAAQQQTQQEA